MGRHSSPSQGPFYRSFFSWLSLWMLIAGVTGLFVWVVVNAVGGPSVGTPADRTSAMDQMKDDSHVQGTRVAREAAPETPVPADTPIEEAPEPPAEPKLKPNGVTVQVLNGTLKPKAGDVMAARLSDLGYSVVAVEESSVAYSQTTVFWSSPDSRDEAMALATHFGWDAQPKPGNLSDTVMMHIVVGADET